MILMVGRSGVNIQPPHLYQQPEVAGDGWRVIHIAGSLDEVMGM